MNDEHVPMPDRLGDADGAAMLGARAPLDMREPGPGGRLLRRFAAVDWSRIGMGAIGIAALLVLWWITAFLIGDEVFLPTPLQTASVLVHYLSRPYPTQGNTLVDNTLISLARILVGFVWGACAGIVLGALMAAIRPVRLIVDPLIELGGRCRRSRSFRC